MNKLSIIASLFLICACNTSAVLPKEDPSPTPIPKLEVTPDVTPAPVQDGLAEIRKIIESGKLKKLKYQARPVLSSKDTALLRGDVKGISPESNKNLEIQAAGDIDLRSWDTPVRNQGQEGLCTAFAVTAALEMKAWSYAKINDFSERHLWSFYGEYYTEKALAASTMNWIGMESKWPYARINRPASVPGIGKHKSWSRLPSFQAVYTALNQNKAVVMSAETNTSWSNPYRGVLQVSGTKQGGHAIKVSGHFNTNKGRYLIIKNSWGPNYGDKGYVYLPEAYCAKFWCAFYVLNGAEFRK